MKKVYYLIIIALCVILGLWMIFFWSNPAPQYEAEQEQIIIVAKGTPLGAIADSLKSKGLIRSTFMFKAAFKLVGDVADIQPGSYRISYGLTNTEIISRLTGSEFAIIFEVTFPEGSTIRKVASIAQQKLGLDSAALIRMAKDSVFLRTLGLPKEAKTAEGYLFPETYRFYIKVSPEELIKRMTAEWKEKLPDSLLAKAKAMGLTTHALLTLASIVEAEANRPDERDTIAGVYWNRLRIGMKLEADPTAAYGLQLSRPITAAEIRIPNPYNTYHIKGLPPGPINNPGKAAILATLSPAKHDKIFFVAKRDGSGGHYFSKTMAEQSAAISRSNKNQRTR